MAAANENIGLSILIGLPILIGLLILISLPILISKPILISLLILIGLPILPLQHTLEVYFKSIYYNGHDKVFRFDLRQETHSHDTSDHTIRLTQFHLSWILHHPARNLPHFALLDLSYPSRICY